MVNTSIKSYLINGGAWAFAGKTVTALANILIAALLARVLLPDDMSAFFLGQSIATFLSISGRFGIENTILKMVSTSLSENQYSIVRSTIEKGLLIVVVSSLFFSIVYISVSEIVSVRLFNSSALYGISGFVAGWMVVLSFQFVFAEIYRAFKDIKSSVIMGGGLFSIGSRIGILFLVLIAGKPDLKVVLSILVGVGGISIFVGLGFLYSRLKALPCEDRKSIGFGELFTHGAYMWVNALSSFILTQSGLWIVGGYYSGLEVAGFGAATRMVLLASMSLVIVNAVIPPLIAKYNLSKKKQDLEIMLRSTATLAAIPALSVFVIYLLVPGELLGVVFGEEYEAYGPILFVLTIGQILNVFVGSCGYVLLMTGHKIVLVSISVVSAIIAIMVGLLLVEHFGAMGVAYASLLAMLFQQGLMLVMVRLKVGVWTHIGVFRMKSLLANV